MLYKMPIQISWPFWQEYRLPAAPAFAVVSKIVLGRLHHAFPILWLASRGHLGQESGDRISQPSRAARSHVWIARASSSSRERKQSIKSPRATSGALRLGPLYFAQRQLQGRSKMADFAGLVPGWWALQQLSIRGRLRRRQNSVA